MCDHPINQTTSQLDAIDINKQDEQLVNDQCPLCGRTGKVFAKGKPLYDVHVCKKCYYAFANRRQLAYLIDLFAWYIISMILLTGFIAIVDLITQAQSNAASTTAVAPVTSISLVLLLMFLAFNISFVFKDGFSGYSPGKWLMNVRVIEAETGKPIGFGKSFKRNLRLMVYTLLCGILMQCAGLAVLILYLVVGSKLCKGPRMGDKWANTKVIWNKFKHKMVFIDNTLCNKCGYDLRVTTRDECPECGNPILPRKRQVIDEIYGKRDSLESEIL